MNTENGTGTDQLYECNVLELPYDKRRSFESFVSELEDGRMTPDSVLDSLDFGRTSSSGSSASSGVGGSGGDSGGHGGAVSCRTLPSFATTEYVKKKRSSIVTVPRVSFQSTWSLFRKAAAGDGTNRRKGVPHRSPLC